MSSFFATEVTELTEDSVQTGKCAEGKFSVPSVSSAAKVVILFSLEVAGC
jgi:hypothetical protein